MASKIKRDPTITIQHMMVLDIIHTANNIDERISRILKKYDITHPQFNILKNVQAASPEPLSAKEIKESIMFSNPDISRLIDRLVKKGLLSRKECQASRRQVDVTITNKGTEAINKIIPEFFKEFNNFYRDDFTDEQALKTIKILRYIRNK